ncbi:MAG: type I-F CRISPR-associated protein Csy1 [Methylococcales bacterium]|nr:type I-F CRISPR-associated protein Csy1 [Methylococcales bacterium]
MTINIRKFESWEDVIKNFFEQKKEVEGITYLKAEIKKIAEQYAKIDYFDDSELESFFDTKKNQKTKEQTDIAFQREKSLKILRLKNKPENIDFKKLISNYRLEIKKINEKFNPNLWLENSSKKASSVSLATHVIKLTHSSITSPSLYDKIDDIKYSYLTTSFLKEKVVDGAVSGAQYAPIFQFLELEFNGEKLASKFADTNNVILDSFSENNEQLTQWNTGFNQALSSKEKSSHSLAKQIYYPVENTFTLEPTSYHLLCHLKSSSLAQAVFEKISDDEQKKYKSLKEKNKYSEITTVAFIKKAKLSVTKSNHINASQLNGKRGGKLFLFSTQPPTWKTQLKPPVYKKSLFDNFSNSDIKEDIDYLRDFLLRFERIDLSIKDPKRYAHLERWVNSIIDEVLFYANSIQKLPSGWSANEDIKLKPAHQYFLDPFRDEENFQNQRKANDWQGIVCKDFASWLNNKLAGKEKQFTPQAEHTRMWITLFENPLREDCETIDAQMQYNIQKETA